MGHGGSQLLSARRYPPCGGSASRGAALTNQASRGLTESAGGAQYGASSTIQSPPGHERSSLERHRRLKRKEPSANCGNTLIAATPPPCAKRGEVPSSYEG